MARDNPQARGAADRPTAGRRSSGFLTGLLIGVLLGIGMALAVAVWLNVHGSPFSEREAAVELPPIKQPSETPRPPGGGMEGSGSSGGALPGDGVGGPELRDAASASESLPAPRAGSAAGLYLQAGAFRNAPEADDRKLSLSLLGQAAVVQRVVSAGGPLYRVRLGPFADPTELDRTRDLLRENGIDSIPVRLDPTIP